MFSAPVVLGASAAWYGGGASEPCPSPWPLPTTPSRLRALTSRILPSSPARPGPRPGGLRGLTCAALAPPWCLPHVPPPSAQSWAGVFILAVSLGGAVSAPTDEGAGHGTEEPRIGPRPARESVGGGLGVPELGSPVCPGSTDCPGASVLLPILLEGLGQPVAQSLGPTFLFGQRPALMPTAR